MHDDRDPFLISEYEFDGHWWYDKTGKEQLQIVAWTAFLFLVIVLGA
jgi:hypothetical protein